MRLKVMNLWQSLKLMLYTYINIRGQVSSYIRLDKLGTPLHIEGWDF